MKTKIIYIEGKTGERIPKPENFEAIAISVMYNPKENIREIYVIVKVKN